MKLQYFSGCVLQILFLSERKGREGPEGEMSVMDKDYLVRIHCLTIYSLFSYFCLIFSVESEKLVYSGHHSKLDQFCFINI